MGTPAGSNRRGFTVSGPRDFASLGRQDALSGTIQLNPAIEVLDESGEVIHRLEFRDAIRISD